ncbi:S-adenosyl-L-methionine-dependent methyltransferase [Aspergillus karnatakaensis]|uniref:class I SAM-dependent methyltransferase n=1 Tax=Aspergillus karnatakaensis TaxID=1810916 RepID=UPI003CCE4DA4
MATPTHPPSGTAAYAFNKASDVYERLTGGCTREVAQYILFLNPKVTSSSVVLDNACGTGIITEEIINLFPDPASLPQVYAADFAPTMISNLTTKATRNGWIPDPNTGTEREEKKLNVILNISVQNAEELQYEDNTFTHSYTNLGFPFFPDGVKAAGQVYRTLSPGGTAFVTTWKKLGYLRPIHQAQLAVRPEATPWEVPMPREWMTREKLVGVLEGGGFERGKIEVFEKVVGYRGEDLDDLMDILKTAFLRLVTEGWSEGEKERWVEEVRGGLTEEEKETARLEMVAWVAVARK